jgi:hypothetical protein
MRMTDKNDVVIGIAASLYASRATDDALRAEPPLEAIANEAWDLYHKLERAVRSAEGEVQPETNRSEQLFVRPELRHKD